MVVFGVLSYSAETFDLVERFGAYDMLDLVRE